DHVGRERLEGFEELLHLAAAVGEEAVLEARQLDGPRRRPEERLGAAAGLRHSVAAAGQDDPLELQSRKVLDQAEHGPAAADLDVVGMGADGQYSGGTTRRGVEPEASHVP